MALVNTSSEVAVAGAFDDELVGETFPGPQPATSKAEMNRQVRLNKRMSSTRKSGIDYNIVTYDEWIKNVDRQRCRMIGTDAGNCIPSTSAESKKTSHVQGNVARRFLANIEQKCLMRQFA